MKHFFLSKVKPTSLHGSSQKTCSNRQLRQKKYSVERPSLLGVVACICNPATSEAEFRNDVGSVPVGGNSPLIGGWIV